MKHTFYAIAALSVFMTVVTVSGSLVINAIEASNAEQPIMASSAATQAAHQAVGEQLLLIGEPTAGYTGTTLRMLPVTSDDSDTLFTDSAPYTGQIIATSGKRYDVELELLTAGDEVIPLFVALTPVEE